MNLNLSNKVILISGGAKGIGGAISRGLIAEGAIPVMIDPSEKEGAEILALGEAFQIPVRLFDAADSENVVKITLEKYGRIDGLVNNAGANDSVGLEKGSHEAFEKSDRKSVV